jgi:hypothetical protein
LKSSGNIHVEREGDRVVVRSQWGNSLVGSICLGLFYIAGVIVIYLLNGEITDNLPSQVVTAGLILVGVYIMLPRRLTATFDSQERRSIRVYNFSFGLVRHRRVIAFDEIVALAIRNYGGDSWLPIVMRKSARPVTLTIEGGSRDDAIKAVETISSATGIAVDRAGFVPSDAWRSQTPRSKRWKLEGLDAFGRGYSFYALGEYDTEQAAVAATQERLAGLEKLQPAGEPGGRDEVGVVSPNGDRRQIFSAGAPPTVRAMPS